MEAVLLAAAKTKPTLERNQTVVKDYYDLTQLIERLHRRFLEVLRAGLVQRGIADVNPVQAMLLLNVGREECSVRDVTDRGYSLGSNAAYNIKKLVDAGYLDQSRSPHDRRSVCIRLTDRGLALYARIQEVQARFAEQFADSAAMGAEGAQRALKTLAGLERLWAERIVSRDI